MAAAAVGRFWLRGVNPPQRRRPIWEGVTPGGGGRPTQIAIFAFSATRQTAMPIRIVPRFCARGCGRFEKLLYGCRNPSRWDRTDVVAKISMLRLNIGSGMLILATTSVLSQRDGFRQPYSNFSNQRYPLAQNRGTILMGIGVWRVVEKSKIVIFVCQQPPAGVTPSQIGRRRWEG